MLKTMKKYLSVFLVVIMALSCVIPCFAQTEQLEMLSVTAVTDSEKTNINWWLSDKDGKYYLFLPDGTDLSSLKVNLRGVSSIKVGEKTVNDAEITDAFALGGEFAVSAADKNYTVVVMRSENIPAVYIETKSGSLDKIHADKSYKEEATIAVTQSGVKVIDTQLTYIKGRGNATWNADKKPYNIKFAKKTDLFGMGKAKKWALLAMHYDKSMIKNTTVLDFAQDIDLAYTSKSTPIDLYINGNYEGTYLVCESVEIGSTRVDITDLEDLNEAANPDINIEECELCGVRGENSFCAKGSKKWVNIPNDPDNITGGYLLEFETYSRYDNEISGFVTKQGQNIIIKSPEYASKAEVEYISSLYQQAEDAVYSETGYNSLGKHYSEYFDVQSFVKMYILQELFLNVDACLSSFFIYKDKDSDMLYAGPAWDFDKTLGVSSTRSNISANDPSVWYVNQQYAYNLLLNEDTPTDQMHNAFYAQLFRHADFRQSVRNVWAETCLPLLGEDRIEKISSDAQHITSSAVMNAFRWNMFSVSSYEKNLSEYQSKVDSVKTFFTERLGYMKKGFSDNAAYIFYNSNGGERFMVDSTVYEKGNSTFVKFNRFDSPEKRLTFVGWNTKPDGSGKSYKPAEAIKLTDESITLYAQWGRSITAGVANRFLSSINNIIKTMIKIIKYIFVR